MAQVWDAEILLVEDDPLEAELVVRALRKSGLEQQVEHVSDGEDALDYIDQVEELAIQHAARRPKLILLDLRLHRMGGLQVLRRLKQDARTRGIPIVAFTSSKLAIEMVQSYGLGVNSYVIKPTDPQQFADVVAAIGRYWLDINELPET
jgi:two-component system response regulator